MRKIAQTIALTLAALAAANAVATDDFRVVVPLYGKKAVNSGIELKVAELPAGEVGLDYGPVDFTAFLAITSEKPYDRADVTWAALSPLPPGLSLTADGYLKGVPTAAAVDAPPFTVSAMYAGKSAAQTYKVVVAAAQPEGFEEPPTPPETGGQQTVSDGAAILTVAPTKLAFGLVARQLPTPPLVVGISNTGTKAADLTVEQPGNAEFKLTHTCPPALPPGAACEASVVFTPKTVYDVKSTFNVFLGKQPVTVSLSGRGQNSTATLTHLPKKQWYQDFGTVATGQFVARQTIIKNTSKYYALGIFDAKVVPGYNGSSQYAIDNEECPKVLAVGESCTITSRFAPTSQGRITTYGRLTMNVSNDRQDIYFTGLAAGSLKITSLSHANAQLPGGQQLTVSGSGFLPDAKVYFGETEAVTRYGSINTLYATVPAVAEPENTYIRVVNPDESEASAPKPFARARSFGQLYPNAGPLKFGKQALNVPSQWQYFYVKNMAAFSTDTLEINDIQVTGPYQLDTSTSYCTVGRKIGYGGSSCQVRVRFVPTEAGDMPGAVTVVGNGEPLTMPLTGLGLAWEGTPSGSAGANTDLPYSTVLSGNEAVGGATQTKYVDVYFRNTNPDAQLNAMFQLADGSAFKFYTVNSTSNTNSEAGLGCVSSSTPKQTTLCRADVGSSYRPHIHVRLQATSVAGLGTHYEELVVLNAGGEEQLRIPLWLDVVYDVTAATYADRLMTTPASEITAQKVQLAQEAYKDIWVANVGTQGMMRSDTVSLADNNSADIYFKTDSLYRTSTGSTGLGTCGRLISPGEMSGCLSDDISGASTLYPHQRVRVYYKPMSSGPRTATLRIVHRGQGPNPIEMPVTISPVDFNAVFSASPATSPQADVPVLRLPANFAIDGSTTSKAFKNYLNSTDGQPLKGVFTLTGPGTEDTQNSLYVGWTNNAATGTGSCTTKNRLETMLCGGSVNYPNFLVQTTISTRMGEGTYDWKVTFYDPSMQELTSLPLRIEIVNDATPEVSLSHNAANPLPNGVLDFGTVSAPAAPGQLMTTVNKVVFVRNLGTIGKMKFSGVAIEGGDGAFTLTNPAYIVSSNGSATSFGGCGSTKSADSYSSSACTTYDPWANPGIYDTGRLAVTYKATAAGRQNAVLKVWHNSKVVPNPLEIPLTAMATGEAVAGEPSSAANATIAPTGTYTPISGSGTRDLNFWIRNPEAYGALYAPEISVEGDAFTLIYTPYRASDAGGATTCGSTLSADKHWATACLADNAENSTSPYKHMRFTVRCTTTTAMPKGTVNTGVLRVKTLGAEHRIPLSCTRS